MAITPFADLYSFFDASVVAVINTGTTNMITLISPLIAACFGIYMMLILSSYWRGDEEEPIFDFLFRMIGWGAVIVFGLNIATYQLYVVPFVNGLGEDLANVVGTNYSSAAALDTMANAFIDAFVKLLKEADGMFATVYALMVITSVGLFGGAFMVVAILYIVLAKLALGILLAVGPLFISAALFPATRELFKNWTAQVLNYVFVIMLFSFVAQIEIAMVTSLIPADFSVSALIKLNLTCAVLVLVSLNLPGLAAALAGGIGISAMIRKIPKLPSVGEKTVGGNGGGSITPGRGNERGTGPMPPPGRGGGSISAESKGK